MLNQLASALSAAIRPEDPALPGWVRRADEEHAQRDLAATPRPGAFQKANKRVEDLSRQLQEAAAERDRLLGLGRQYRQKLHAVSVLEERLAEAHNCIEGLEQSATESWGHAATFLGDAHERNVSVDHTTRALSCEATAKAMRDRVLPGLEAELKAAKDDVTAFGRRHDIAEIEAAEAEVE